MKGYFPEAPRKRLCVCVFVTSRSEEMEMALSALRESPGLLSAVLLALLLLVVLFRVSRQPSSPHRDSLLLCGPSDSGKTLLCYRLCLDLSPVTITSMKPSTLEFSPQKIPVVDFPGHPRLRSLLYSTYLEKSREILFCIDASNVQSQAREAAEFLYDLFTNPLIDNVRKFHVVCNKSDIANARPPARIKLTLQQELEKIKKTRNSLDESDDTTFVPLGREGKPFNFDHDSPVEIDFISLSAKNDSVESIVESIGL